MPIGSAVEPAKRLRVDQRCQGPQMAGTNLYQRSDWSSCGLAAGAAVFDDAHRAELVVTLGDELGRIEGAELVELALQSRAQVLGGGRKIAVRAARPLLDDLVADAEAEEIGRGELQLLGGRGDLALVLPEDRRAALGRDHR